MTDAADRSSLDIPGDAGLLSFLSMTCEIELGRDILLAWVLIAFTIAIAIGSLGTSGPVTIAGLIALGWCGWTLLEYLLHRFVLHWAPQSRWGLAARRHLPSALRHMEDPSNPRATLNRIDRSVCGAVFIFAVLASVIGWESAALVVLGGGIGYVVSEMLHLAIHQWPVRGRIGIALKRHHLIHHQLDRHCNYGLQTPFWDWIFGTLYRRQKSLTLPTD